jgi:hypothetical protein
MSTSVTNFNKTFYFNNNCKVHSVSLIFYSEKYGFLLCDEKRKESVKSYDPKILFNHLIGGKTETKDSGPIYSAFREFCEEISFSFINCNMDETVNKLINLFNDSKKVKYDYCVNHDKNLYNRYYIVNIYQSNDEELGNYLLNSIINWSKSDRSPLERVYFWNGKDKFINPSVLLKFLSNNLPNLELLV